LLLLNAFSEDREFILPPPAVPWRVALDAADFALEPNGGDGLQAAGQRKPDNHRITVAAHSAVLLVADDVTL
jgi:isoamylase